MSTVASTTGVGDGAHRGLSRTVGEEAERTLAAAFERVAEAEDDDPVLTIESRSLRARRRAGASSGSTSRAVWRPRSQNDYLEIVAQFHTVVLSNVPRMSASQASEARRFTWLVDVLYDTGSSCCSLPSAGRGALSCRRTGERIRATVSRLEENASPASTWSRRGGRSPVCRRNRVPRR